MRSGFVAVVGRPNAGKSYFLNWLAGNKIAIVSHKAQATRKRINVIVMHKSSQVVFIDTPGIHEKEKALNKFMLEEAVKAMGDCDLILFLSPVTDSLKNYEKFLKLSSKPHIVILTKIDKVSNKELLEKISQFKKYQDKFLELIPVSAKKNISKEKLLDVVVKYLPIHPYYYDPEIITTQYIKDIYKELIREAIFEKFSDEIPYCSDVVIDKIQEKEKIDIVYATMIVEKKSQKSIVIGKNGVSIKRVGVCARQKLEKFSKKKIYLHLFLKVKNNWTKKKEILKELGYFL